MPSFAPRSFRRTSLVRVLAAWAALCCGAVVVRSADSRDRYSFDPYGSVPGLAGTVITVAVQTRDGYLWVGTPSGLSRFDGVRFVSFHGSDTPALHSDVVYCVVEDAAGTLWIGTAKGVTRYAQGRFDHVAGLEVPVRSLRLADDGRVLASTEQGAWLLGESTAERVEAELLPPTARVRTAYVDSSGRIWVALERSRGVLRGEAGGFALFGAESEPFSEVLSICEHPRGTMWFGTQRNGLFRLRQNQLQRVESLPLPAGRPIFQILPARDGGLWVAAGAVYRAFREDELSFTAVPDLPNQNVRALCEDREGGLWLCAGSEGIVRMRPSPYRLLSTHSGLPSNNVKTIAEDASGTWWLSVRGEGVVRVRPDGTVLLMGPGQGMARSDPAVVFPMSDGTVWAGLNSHLWRGGDAVWHQDPEIRFVRGLYQDRRGVIWVGTDALGLFKNEGGTSAPVLTAEGGVVSAATSFAEAPDGSLVVGTWRTGLFRIGPGRATAEAIAGVPAAEVRAVWVDADGLIWAGLSGRGLALYEDGRWLNPAALTEALGGQVCGIIGDAEGRVWLGTLGGISWARREELLRWMRQPASAPPIHAIAAANDARTLPVWSGGQPVVWSARDGTLLFATRRGVAVIDPARATLNPVSPPVHVERVFVDRHFADLRQPLRMPAGTRSLTIEYTALSFVQPGRVLFRYKLEGYDAEWIEAGTRRAAYYSSLPPGDYRFTVRACNDDGVWNTVGASVSLTQLPHVYETLWFRLALLSSFGAFAWGAYAWSNRQLRFRLERLERERAMENERRRIAQDLHDDLGARLTEIGLFAETARRAAPGSTDRGLDFLSQRVRVLVGSLDAIVWAVNPANDSLDQLVSYVADLFQELLRPSAIRARLDIAADIPRLPLTAEERSDLFFTAKEAMNNLVKHSGATEAWLRVAMEGSALRLTLHDNGCGFDRTAGVANGNGLANMRQRVARVGGMIEWQSTPGQGTQVTVVVSFAGREPVAAEPGIFLP